MFGRRCTLCGGKLDSHGVCKECGLDNNKNDKNYRAHESSCDNRPLTHVHEEEDPGKPVRSRPVGRKPVRQRKNVSKKKSKGCVITILILVLVFVFVNGLGEGVFLLIRSIKDKGEEYLEGQGERENPYASVTRQIPDEGDQMEYRLDSGSYIVGVHIPEGVYQAETNDDFDVVSVNDDVENIYLYEYEEKEGGNYLDDLRLYQGAEVEIDATTPVVLTTSNAQTAMMAGEDNPLTETYVLSGEQTAGENFEPGVYDLEVTEGTAEITVEIVCPDGDYEGELYQEKSLYMGSGSSTGTIYRNLVLPEDAVIRCEDDVTVFLTPSPVIESADYFSYYEND